MYFGRQGVFYDSHAANRRAAGEEGLHRESSLPLIGHMGVTYDSQPPGYAVFNSHPD